MADEINWSDPVKGADVESAAPMEAGLFQVCTRAPNVVLVVGAAGPDTADGIRGAVRRLCEQEDGEAEVAPFLAEDLEIGTVFGVDIKQSAQRKKFIVDQCRFLFSPMPNSTQAEIAAASASARETLKSRYPGKAPFSPIEW